MSSVHIVACTIQTIACTVHSVQTVACEVSSVQTVAYTVSSVRIQICIYIMYI